MYIWKDRAKTKRRALGIPTVTDRVVQSAAAIVRQPIFEADFHDHSYAYRPKRRTHQAMDTVREALLSGKVEVVDADLSSYFDLIPHRQLLQLVANRVSDGRVLRLIKMWLRAPIVEEDRETGFRKVCPNRCGTPQGGVISPLLAKLYLNDLDHAVNEKCEQKPTMVRYADDLLILCKPGQGAGLQKRLKPWLEARQLKLNEEKTRLVDTRKEGFEFLCFVVAWRQSLKSKRRYPHVEPSAKSQAKLRDKVREVLEVRTRNQPAVAVVRNVNAITRGWATAFHYGNSTHVNSYTGTTTIGGGTLALSGGNNRLPATGTVNFSTAGTLDLGSTRQTLAKLTTDNSITGTVKGTGGTLALSGAAFQLGSATSSSSQTLNLATLSTFTYLNPPQPFHVGGLAIIGSNGASGTLTAALTTTITAASVGIGTGGARSSTANAGTLKLGTTTGINAGTLMIGANYHSTGTLQYPAGTTNPALTLRGTDGASRVTSLLIGDNNGPTVATSGTVDLTTNVTGVSTLDARIDTAGVGRNSRTSSAGGNFIQVAGSFSMGAGTLDVAALTIGQVLAGFINGGTTSSASGTLTVGGGIVKVATLSLGDHLSAASANSGPCAGTFNLNSGSTLAAQTIQAGAGASNTTRTFNWNDGTIKNYDASTDLNFGAGLTTCALLGTGLHAFAIDSGRQATIQQALSGAGGLTKLGVGTLTLNAANTYTGTTTVSAGTLSLAGSLTSSISNAATLAPQGQAVTIKAFTQTATGTLLVRLNGTTVGSGYDQLKTPGPVTLAGTLELVAAPTLAVGNSFTLIDNTGTTAVSGTFAGLTEGAAFFADDQWWSISYTSGTGNDVVVSLIAASAWQTWQAQNFGAGWADPLIAGDAVDFDHDGQINLLEYAIGTDPTATTAAAALPVASIEAGKLTLTHNRNTAATDVTLIVQGTDSLNGTWTDLSKSVAGEPMVGLIGGVTVSETGTGASRTVKVGDLYLASDVAHPKRFLRLKVVR